MAGREIKEYLEARQGWVAAWRKDGSTPGERQAANDARRAAWKRLTGLDHMPFPPNLWLLVGGSIIYETDTVSPEEDELVFFPMLVEQLDGDEEATKVAWGLGMRPAGYPGKAA